jgi:hypothetical protein
LLKQGWALLTVIAAILNVPLMLLSVAGFLGFNLDIFVIGDFLRAVLPIRLTDHFVRLDSWQWGNIIAYVICASLLFFAALRKSRFFLFRPPWALLIIPFFLLPAITVAFSVAELLMTTLKGCWVGERLLRLLSRQQQMDLGVHSASLLSERAGVLAYTRVRCVRRESADTHTWSQYYRMIGGRIAGIWNTHRHKEISEQGSPAVGLGSQRSNPGSDLRIGAQRAASMAVSV